MTEATSVVLETAKYVAWGPERGAVVLHDDRALVRWAQARLLSEVEVWFCDDDAETMSRCSFVREFQNTWRLQGWADGEKFDRRIPADPSDDPRVLLVVDLIEDPVQLHEKITPMRCTQWPPAWAEEIDEQGLWTRIGSLPMVRDEAAGEWRWYYSPDVLAENMAGMDGDDMTAVMNVLHLRQAIIAMHAAAKGVDEAAAMADDMIRGGLADDIANLDDPQTPADLFMRMQFVALDRPAPDWVR